MSFADILVAISIAAMAAVFCLPSLTTALRAWRLESAVRDLAIQMTLARTEAASREAHVGLVFDTEPGSQGWSLHVDGNANGIRSEEVISQTDRRLGRPMILAQRHPGVRFGIPTSGIPRIPPATGILSPADDPIALGGADIFSASPIGGTSGGTLYMTDGRDLRAIVVYGPTGRVRLLGWDPRAREWDE